MEKMRKASLDLPYVTIPFCSIFILFYSMPMVILLYSRCFTFRIHIAFGMVCWVFVSLELLYLQSHFGDVCTSHSLRHTLVFWYVGKYMEWMWFAHFTQLTHLNRKRSLALCIVTWIGESIASVLIKFISLHCM